jgi:VanZ family protein
MGSLWCWMQKRCCEGTTPYEWHVQWGAVIVLTFAAIEECTQYYIPSRTFDLWDLAADFVGVVLVSILIPQKEERKRKE